MNILGDDAKALNEGYEGVTEIYRRELEEEFKKSGYDIRVGCLLHCLDFPDSRDHYFELHHYKNRPISKCGMHLSARTNQVVGFVFPLRRKVFIEPYFDSGFPGREFLEDRGYELEFMNCFMFAYEVIKELIHGLERRDS